jgi:hypothetical protein
MSSPSYTTHSLSAEGHSYSDNNTRSLSPQKVTRSICVLRCPRRPVPFAAASSRALRNALNFSPRKAGAVAGWLAVCMMAKGARADVDRAILCAVLCAVAKAATPPPILLLGRARLVESPRQGEN